MREYYDECFIDDGKTVFVFGSNLAGIHGAGAALTALRCYGAVYGVGEGRTGQSYALPTKGYNIESLSLEEVKASVDRFLGYALSRPEDRFFVTRVGCGLAGFTDAQIGPMFKGAPDNCVLPRVWAGWDTL